MSYTAPVAVEVDEGTYEITAAYGTFSETKTAYVLAGETVTVEFRWFKLKGTLNVRAYVDDEEVSAQVTIVKVG